jgi:hypothetical protein
MERNNTNANALREQGIGGAANETTSDSHLTDMGAVVKADLLNGRRVRPFVDADRKLTHPRRFC